MRVRRPGSRHARAPKIRPHAAEPAIFRLTRALEFIGFSGFLRDEPTVRVLIHRERLYGLICLRRAEDLTTPTVDDMVTGGDIPNNRAVRFDGLQMIDLDRPVETAQ
jgi:hypothetical protein